MKNLTRLTAAFLLVLSILITALPMSVEVSAATLVYSTDSNSGKRGDICTTLDGTSADDYYTGDYTYNNLSELSSDALFRELQELMRDTHKKTSSYDDCHYKADKSDCEENNGKVTLIYTSYKATMGQWNGWNREHVWPKSLGGDSTKGGGADMHHIRPSDAVVNSTRGNKKYGNVDGGKEVNGKNPASGILGGHSGTYFEPLDSVKGDVARICLYVYVRWNSQWGATSITKVFQSVDVLLEWCEMDPVDTWEMGRNEVVGAYQGNRNVFIDYPEYAWLLFDREVPEGMTTPSGMAEAGDPDCKHTKTEVRNPSNATCGKEGYTGDTYCKDCGKKLSEGTKISATGKHSFGQWVASGNTEIRTCTVCQATESRGCTHQNRILTGATEPTCGKAGFTGDHICQACGVKVVPGTRIEPTGDHEFGEWETTINNGQNRTCKVCGETETRPLPACNHPSIGLTGVVEPTCGTEGYTGDSVCNDCGTLLTAGEIVPASGNHVHTHYVGAVAPTCGKEGETGALKCTDCGNMVADSEKIAPTGDHKNTELRESKDATCGEDGYTGDTYCLDCGTKLKDGEVIPATGKHELEAGEILVEPTKKDDGSQIFACKGCGLDEIRKLPATGPDNTVIIIAIVVASVLLVGTAVIVTVIIVKKKKKA